MNKMCLIGARKGSKRFPNKNKQLLLGQPLFSYTLEAALEFGGFDKVILSTDDEDIMEYTHKHYPEVICDLRPDALSGDDVVYWDVAKYVMGKYESYFNPQTQVCMMSPCHPFRRGDHIKEGYELYQSCDTQCVASITPFHSPPHLNLELSEEKIIKKEWSGRIRAADHAPKFFINGGFFIIEYEYFTNNKNFYNEKSRGYVMGWPESLDIDYEEDFKMAQMICGEISYQLKPQDV